MDGDDVHVSIEYVSSSGAVLSVEHKAALETSLVILRDTQKAHRVKFWGKVVTTHNDYFVAESLGKDELAERKSFYSRDCVGWVQLPEVDSILKEVCSSIRGRFTGDPSFEHRLPAAPTADGTEGEELIVTEEKRLAALVVRINQAVSIVPRGAFIKTPTGVVEPNRNFGGLSVSAAAKLSSYFHFREAINLKKKSLLQREHLEKSIDFLDPIDEDIPKESWSLQFEKGSGLVTLRSLLWPGFTFYHVPNTSRFGYVYFGIGESNYDLGFMF
eukprot:Opistho-2@25345